MGKYKRSTFHVDGCQSTSLNRTLEKLLKGLSKPDGGIYFADLFCGIGSFHVALKDAGCTCAYACDISKHAKDFYEANYCHTPDGDIMLTDPMDVPDFDILCAGFPCQSFSLMGKREGLKDKINGHMFDHLMRFVLAKRPSVIILENVQGILSADNGRVMDYIRGSLGNARYRVTHTLLKCNEFGIPQRRCRVFIVGIMEGVSISKPVSRLLDVDDFKEDATLSDFLLIPLVKKYANTIRIGGRSNTYSTKNWNQYLMSDDEIYQLSVEDGIRLQGFEGKIFEDSESQVWKLLGNTIPTVLSRLVVYSVLSNVDLIPYRDRPSGDVEEVHHATPLRSGRCEREESRYSFARFNTVYIEALLSEASEKEIMEATTCLRYPPTA